MKKLARKINLSIFIGFFGVSILSVFAQIAPVAPKIPVTNTKIVSKQNIKIDVRTESESVEKSLAVDAKVNISMCVSEGRLKVNGWDRNEIRTFISDGSAVGYKVLQKNKQDKIVWAMVVGTESPDSKRTNSEECLSGAEIELDVPRGAIVNIKGQTSETKIDSVEKVSVENVGGDIFLSNIGRGIEAKTYEGDVTVENSSGAMTLTSTTGNIVAFEVEAGEIGDIFKAKTSSGAITLQNIEHRQIEAGSNSGSIKFTGAFQIGGQYNLGTQNGSIALIIPEKSSFKINALYGYGRFDSEIKLNINTIDNSSKAQRLSAILGNGDATVNLTTFSGSLRIKKR